MDRVIEQKTKFRKKHISYAIAGVLFMLLFGTLLFNSRSASMHVQSRNIIVAQARQGVFHDYIRLSGNVKPKTTILLTALESGIVEQRLVNSGAFVKKGDTLMILRNNNLQKEVYDAESQYMEKQNSNRDAVIALHKEKLAMQQQHLSAKIEASRSKRSFEQQKSLYDDGLTTREEYLRAKENYELAHSNLQLLQERLQQDSLYRELQHIKMTQSVDNMSKNLELAHRRVDNLHVRATHDGQLASFDAQLGQNISEGSVLGVINVLDDYKIQVQIDERYIDRVTTGLSGVLERKEKNYDVTIATVYPDVKEGQFRADFIFASALPENIRVGQTYYLNLELGEPVQAILLPRGAFFASVGGKYVYVLSPDGSKAVRRPIKIARQNVEYYEVVEGLEQGEQVIISSYDPFGECETLIIDRK